MKYCLIKKNAADLVFHLNSDGQPLPIPEDYKKIEDFTGPVKSTDKGTWYSLIAASRNMFVHNVPVLTGETLSKLNLMKKLGYKPILVNILFIFFILNYDILIKIWLAQSKCFEALDTR